jgi:hypothetical protein
MRRFIRLAIAAGAVVSALAFSGSALAAYAPTLAVRSLTSGSGNPTTVRIEHYQSLDDDATAKDTIYAPLGYGVNLTQPVGTKIGDIGALLVLRQGGNAQIEVTGAVTADSPANYPPATNQCTPGQSHEAVWRADVTVAGTPLRVPMYVDRVTAGPEAAFASAKIQLCLAGPIGTPAGAQLFDAIFDVQGVFTNPTSPERRIWRALFTPYVAGTPTPNPAGTIESQAWAAARTSLSLSAKRLKRGVTVLQGRLTVDGAGISGPSVDIYSGTRRVGRTRLTPPNRYTFRKRIKRKTRFQARINFVGEFSSCFAPPIGAPQGCRTASLWIVANSRTVSVKPRR